MRKFFSCLIYACRGYDISSKKLMADPIWKDKFIEIGSSDYAQYRISVHDTGDVIYTGKAYMKPEETDIAIRINDICADYLENVLPNLSQTEFSRITLPVTFDIEVFDGDDWVVETSVEFLYDWSYDYAYDVETMGMSFPITGRIDLRMPIVWTGYDVSEVDATIYLKDGTSFDVTIPVEISADFNDDFNNDFARSAMSAGSGTAVFLPSQWGDVDRVEVGQSTFKVVTECAKYALYYVNAYGGWDTLLVEGNHLESDNLTRYTREMVYDNREISNRGKVNYANEVTKTFTLHTGWLPGDRGEMMHHLINSTNVYLYDIPGGKMIPVTIGETTCEYKNYKNQGNKLVDYTIQVEVAQNRTRR